MCLALCLSLLITSDLLRREPRVMAALPTCLPAWSFPLTGVSRTEDQQKSLKTNVQLPCHMSPFIFHLLQKASGICENESTYGVAVTFRGNTNQEWKANTVRVPERYATAEMKMPSG